MKKASILVCCMVALAVIFMWVPIASSFESYHDPTLDDAGYCSDCHPGFTGGRSDVTHALHTGGDNPITTNCNLCHTESGRDNPLTLWSVDNLYGCAGCHGREYGETIGADYRGFPISELPKSSAYGLRMHHLNAGITLCSACHDTVVPLPENIPPIYFTDPVYLSNVTDPCADNLDNDGDGLYDAEDPDCAEPVCGNGVVETGEECDDGAANGTTTCGCQLDCTYTPVNTPCDDGLFCNAGESCDGAGQCGGGSPLDCSDGVGCTDDICDETNNACVNTPNDANCPDDGLFCNGTEFCDPVNDCSSTGDPCPPDTTCNEVTDTCDAAVIDLDIARFSAPKSVRLAKVKPIEIKLVVRNNGVINSQTRPAILTGMQNGVQVYTETQDVYDDVGDGRSTFKFGPYSPTAKGDILWTVTIFDDDPDDDTATAVTKVK